MNAPATLYCGFCGKSQHDAVYVLAGVDAFICDECVDLCAEIVAERRAVKTAADATEIKFLNEYLGIPT